MRFRTYAHFDDPDLNLNRGYGLIEVAYNGSVVNSTFMGSKMRGGIDMDPKAIVVRYDDGGLTVTHDGELVIADQIPGWAPTTDWQFGWGARTGDRKDNHWIDDVRVSSGFLLDTGAVAFGVTLNNGSDVSPLAPPAGYTYTADPAVFSFSPTTGPTDGNTTVVLKGSMLAGGSDYAAASAPRGRRSRDVRTRREELTCVSPRVDAGLLPAPIAAPRWWRSRCRSTTVTTRAPACLGASTYRPTSTTPAGPTGAPAAGTPPSSLSPRLTLAPPAAATRPAGVGAQLSLLGSNFSGGDHYLARFLSSPEVIVNATFVNDTLVRCVAPAEEVEAQSSAVQLSLNGQQFTVAVAFPFFAVYSISPTTGAATGGTLVTVNGTAFDAGECKGTGHCRFRCRFGACGGGDDGVCVAEASRVDSQTLRCHAPPRLNNDTGLFALEVSLNARDYTSNLVGYEYFAPLALDHPRALLPASGPREATPSSPSARRRRRTPSRAARTCSVASARSPRGATTWRCRHLHWQRAARGERRRGAAVGARAPQQRRLLGRRPPHCGGEAQRLAGPATARGCACRRSAVRRDSVRVAAARRRRQRDDDRAVRRLSQRTRLLQHVVAVHVLRAAAAVGGGAAARAGGGSHAAHARRCAAPPSSSTPPRAASAPRRRPAAVHSVRTLELMRPTGQIAADVLQCDVPGAEAAARGTVSSRLRTRAGGGERTRRRPPRA